MVVLVQGDRELSLGAVELTDRCDLALIEELLWLQLQARRHGWSVHIRGARRDLRELFDLVGLTDRLDD